MGQAAETARSGPVWWQRYGLSVALYSGGLIAAMALLNIPIDHDYVGPDNDDVMRLVQVRDFLDGQRWFDLMQYRLGLEGGTLMHWSRLVDLPIAALILLFGLFFDQPRAEMLALTVWPLFLVVPLMAAMGLAGRRMGGPQVMHVAMGLTALLVATGNRFLPGAIDHHNVQLVLVAALAAMLVDEHHRPSSMILAGVLTATAIAVGAETTPILVTACLIVAVSWAVLGKVYAAAAKAFAISLILSITALFFATTPPHLYAVVACDSLSIAYYGLASIGGILLLASVMFGSRLGIRGRFGLLAAAGVVILLAALVLAPECLRSPLADLDPMLKRLWLERVVEAQSAADQLRQEPGLFGAFYAVGVFAMAVCVFRIVERDRVRLHAVLLPLIAVAWTVALVQVRGAVFANLLAVLPLALLIGQLRRATNRDPENLGLSFAFVITVLLSVPNVWAFFGVMSTEGTAGLINRLRNVVPQVAGPSTDCTSARALRQLATLPEATVAAPSESGASILRFTHHRVLAAPYHRNEGGMLTELHIGLSQPDEAPAFLRGSRTTIIAFCPSDPQTTLLMETKPDGLYAALGRGDVPPYLKPLPAADASGFTIYEVHLADE
ncbi:hypothetical protein J5J10_16895 [Ciceribacter sp. L1K23]|uniref:hypothetical protein n=1 Tax=Ciceribacter sp. L1K23 TaxID=2820276 RepID=UPI001B80F8A3|nr:hypothetical protein [Ciceribacter sp. L1K23]MBR0557367.1 hypothetical protein [Ciceribacter sp. L1K23]